MKYISDKVRWGIIGAGDVCERKSAPSFHRVPGSEWIAVMRRDINKVREFALRHNVPRYYSSVSELLADDQVNAIYIATPPAYHQEYAVAAAKAGKPVYIEKPVTLDAVGCEELIRISRQYKIPMTVAHYRRRLPQFMKIKEMINGDLIGEIKLIDLRLFQSPAPELVAKSEKNWRIVPEISGGGLFHDLAPHQLDILCWLFGEPSHYFGYSFNQGGQYTAPDVTCLHARFQCSVFFKGVWSFNMPEKYNADHCDIYGEKGKISFSFFRNPVIELQTDQEKKIFETSLPETIQEPMISDVVRYFQGKIPNPAPLEEALWSMQLLDCTL